MSAILITAVVISVIFFIFLLGGIYVKNTNVICTSKKRLDGKTVIVTGGTAGMGLEIAKDLAQRGARVIVACPYPDEGAQAVKMIKNSSDTSQVVFKLLDLASLTSTRNFAADILKTEERLDILINNAGVGGPTTDETLDGMNFIMQVNYFGTFLLTLLLLPLLKKSGCPGEPSRIVTVSSVLHWLGEMNTGKNCRLLLKAYANSKLCVVLFSRELTNRLKGSNVVINNSDPGAVGTNIFLTCRRHIGLIATYFLYILSKTPWQGAQTALHVALDKKAGEVSGEYFKNCELTRASWRTSNHKSAIQLWEESVRLVKMTEEELDQCLNSS